MASDDVDLVIEDRGWTVGAGCRRLAIASVVLGAVIVVACTGVGLPYVYWHQIRDVHVFEGPHSVVLFVGIERAMRYPGLWQEAPINRTARLMRITIPLDGVPEATRLQIDPSIRDEYLTFNDNLANIFRRPDGFYMLNGPRSREGWGLLLRIGSSSIEAAPDSEVEVALRAIRGRGPSMVGPSLATPIDAITESAGWQRIARVAHGFLPPDPITAPRSGVRLSLTPHFVETDSTQTITAEIRVRGRPTRYDLLSLSNRRWRSYRSPTAP